MTRLDFLNEHIKDSGQDGESIIEREEERCGPQYMRHHSLFKGLDNTAPVMLLILINK